MWIAIWALIAIFVFGASIWSYRILMQQKKCWSAFGKKYNMEYQAGKLMDSPSLKGKIDGRTVLLYTDVQQTPDMRGQRYVTTIELELGEGVPASIAVGTSGLAGFINDLALKKDFVPDHADWKKGTEEEAGYLMRTRNLSKLKAYMTAERIDVLVKLFKMKNSQILFFCDEVDGVLRIETSDPMRNLERMEKIVKRLVRDLNVLAPNSDERALVPKKRDDDDEEDELESAGADEAIDEAEDEAGVDETEENNDIEQVAEKKPAAKTSPAKKAPAKKSATKKTGAKKAPAKKPGAKKGQR